jgi:hypothetical protein
VTFDPAFAAYRAWLNSKGRSTYASFLLTHPASDISGPFADRQRLLRPAIRGYAHTYYVDGGPVFRVIGSIGMPSSQGLVEIWIVAALLAAIALARRRRNRVLLVTVALSTLLLVVHYLVDWHGDALELDRHAIAAAVQLRVVLWIVTALVVDEIATRRSVRAGGG